eukprot:6478328-Amphidinium_carterae.1
MASRLATELFASARLTTPPLRQASQTTPKNTPKSGTPPKIGDTNCSKIILLNVPRSKAPFVPLPDPQNCLRKSAPISIYNAATEMITIAIPKN